MKSCKSTFKSVLRDGERPGLELTSTNMESNLLASRTAARSVSAVSRACHLTLGYILDSHFNIFDSCMLSNRSPSAMFFVFLQICHSTFLSPRICFVNIGIHSENISKIIQKIFCTSSLEKSQWIKAALSFFRLGLRPK